MKVLVGAGDLDFLADQASQHGGDGGSLAVPHVGVADKGDVGAAEFIPVGFHEAGKVLAA
jgi:hypothetical protein